jgi:hypothetical protein
MTMNIVILAVELLKKGMQEQCTAAMERLER